MFSCCVYYVDYKTKAGKLLFLNGVKHTTMRCNVMSKNDNNSDNMYANMRTKTFCK